MNAAADFLDALIPVVAQYTRGPDTFQVRVAIQESDRAFRTSKRDELIGSDASGVVLTDPMLRRGGRLTIAGGTEYRIDRVMSSPVPGLSDLSLERVAGAERPVFDASSTVPLDQEIELNGKPIAAHVNPSVEVEEVGRDGTRVVVSKMMIAIRAADAVGIQTGAAVRIDGRRRAVARVMSDGFGMVKLLV